jgi:glycosyltransferase involved in cell wall biosynthesis
MMGESVRPRIFLHELYWDMRSRNTDWRYVRFALPLLAEYEPDLEFITETSRWLSLVGNLKAIRAAAGRRVGRPLSLRTEATDELDQAELAQSGCNMIFARAFPLNAGEVPVIWEGGLVDREMFRSYGVSAAYMEEEFALRTELFHRATVIKLFSDAEQRRHAAMFPDIADRFVAVPWFASHVKACSREALHKHLGAETIRILFVGNHAARKGLDQLFDAFLQLPASVQARAQLTVISNFDRSNIKVPIHKGIKVLRGAPSERVMEEMKRAHIFVNVAKLETYGVVFHEAMSQGVACMAPNWEVQRELFDDGRAGMNLPCETSAVKSGLERLIEDEEYRYQLALAGWTRFQEKYAPARVAEKYAAMFRAVANRL